MEQRFSDIEIMEWIESLDYILEKDGDDRGREILAELQNHAHKKGVKMPFSHNTPYINTIPADEQPVYPGNREIERRIKSMVRWNAMAMVVKANRVEEGIGGHISSYASAATLYEVGFNHFFRGPSENFNGDMVFFQGHASPGIYARAYLEGRLSTQELNNFRHEAHEGEGLPSYPHPWLKPSFWQFATVSMGLGPIMAIYLARYNRYLEDRGLKKSRGEKVWAFLGDGETDEPETLGAISLASREKLDNLIFVINANLQRLDGPVRGNGRIIQELETNFRGAGWNVIKVIWGKEWDELLSRDRTGLLIRRMGEVVDGQSQNYTVRGGKYIREHFFGKYPELLKLVEHMSDEQLAKLPFGGHDPEKIYAAYASAVKHEGAPTVVIARTVKGYGLGDAGEGKNFTHSQKKLNEKQLRSFRSRFGIPISDEDIDAVPFYRFPEDSPEHDYLHARRKELGGYLPQRRTESDPVDMPEESVWKEFDEGTGDRAVSTTMAFVRILTQLLKDKALGKLVVPIVPDEARTFGMEALFRQVGIYSHVGQLYEPVDSDSFLYYKEALNGQILEEGITESGSMSSFIASGTSYSLHNIPTIPFYIFYSMFGIQRVGDLVWAAGDMRARGFMIGGTAGRTTLAGEGLQHQDGNSHLYAYAYPTLKAYDPAYAYEIAAIIRHGLKSMYVEQNPEFYYLTAGNENYVQLPRPTDIKDLDEKIIRGMYRFRKGGKRSKGKLDLFGSGALLPVVLKAADVLETEYDISCDVFSVTSYKSLYWDAIATEREQFLSGGKSKRQPYIQQCLKGQEGPVVAVSDYVKAVPESLSKWIDRPMISLGTDGFGRSDGRDHLRDFFEVNVNYVVFAGLFMLHKGGTFDAKLLNKAKKDLEIDENKPNPMTD